MKYLLLIILSAILAGCVASPRIHDSGISKHPFVLTLHDDGSYQLEHLFMNKEIASGRWTTTLHDSEMEIVLLQPNAPDQENQYAYLVDPEKNLISLWLYEDMQSVWINHIPSFGEPRLVTPASSHVR